MYLFQPMVSGQCGQIGQVVLRHVVPQPSRDATVTAVTRRQSLVGETVLDQTIRKTTVRVIHHVRVSVCLSFCSDQEIHLFLWFGLNSIWSVIFTNLGFSQSMATCSLIIDTARQAKNSKSF